MSDMAKQWEDFKELIDKCRKKAEDFGTVTDFFIHGSRATDKFHADSDLDLCFVVNGGDVEVEAFKNIIKELFECKEVGVYYLNGERWSFWIYKGREVGVHVYTKKSVNEKVDELYISFENFEKYSPWVQHTIRESCSVFESGGSLSEWKKKVESYPINFFRKYRQTYLDYLKGKIEWMELRPVWKGLSEEILDTYNLYEVLIKCHYAFNPQTGFYMPGAKNYAFDAKEMNPNIEANLNGLLEGINKGRDLLRDKHKQKLILEEIVSKFVKISNDKRYNTKFVV